MYNNQNGEHLFYKTIGILGESDRQDVFSYLYDNGWKPKPVQVEEKIAQPDDQVIEQREADMEHNERMEEDEGDYGIIENENGMALLDNE